MTGKIVDSLFGDMEPLKWWEKIYYPLCRKWDSTKYFFQRVIQTVKYGFPDEQVFDFFSWHSKIVLPRLKRFRKNLHGYPSGLTETEWGEILDKIIWSFEHCDDDIRPIYSDDFDHRFEVSESESGMRTYSPMNETGTVDWSPIHKHNEQVQEGLLLFAKYYRNLWD